MQARNLGLSGLKTPPLVLGGNVFGWTADKARSFQILDAFVSEGFSLIDTSDAYTYWIPGNTGGDSEMVIGEWLAARGVRDRVLIATKVGAFPPNNGLKAGQIEAAVEASLKRLQTDYIDLYQSHKDDPSTPLEETLTAYDRLIKAGKVRAIGASNYSAERLKEALAISKAQGSPRYETVQPLYNLLERGIESDLLPLCRTEGLGVLTYFSLAAGFLSGKYRSEADLGKSPRGPMVKHYLNDKGFAVLKALDDVAKVHGVSPTEIALAWVMAKPGVTAAIASATDLDQLQQLFAAARLSLTTEDMRTLDAANLERQL